MNCLQIHFSVSNNLNLTQNSTEDPDGEHLPRSYEMANLVLIAHQLAYFSLDFGGSSHP